MNRTTLLCALAALALLVAPSHAKAEARVEAEAEAKVEAQPDLYQEALQSIAEGRKNDASATLSRLIDREPLHAGAWMELALIQCGLGHAAEAERLFSAIEQRFDPPPGILELIATARRQGCATWESQAQGSLSLARGIDQNVNQGPSNPLWEQTGLLLSPEFQPKHDQYTLVAGDYMRDITANGSTGFAQFQARRNDMLHQYDSASLFAGVESPWRFGRWTARASAIGGLIMLGGQLYQRQYQLQGRIGPPIPLPGSLQFSVIAGLTYADYFTLANFNSRTTELRGLLVHRDERNSARASLAYLDDHALSDRPGGDRRGISGNLSWRRSLGERWTGELGYNHQDWRGTTAYAPGVIDQVRHQRTDTLMVSLSYPLSKSQTVQLEARQVLNRENISIFQYNNRQLQLSWQWQGL